MVTTAADDQVNMETPINSPTPWLSDQHLPTYASVYENFEFKYAPQVPYSYRLAFVLIK
jgi:hypothetical protein